MYRVGQFPVRSGIVPPAHMAERMHECRKECALLLHDLCGDDGRRTRIHLELFAVHLPFEEARRYRCCVLGQSARLFKFGPAGIRTGVFSRGGQRPALGEEVQSRRN